MSPDGKMIVFVRTVRRTETDNSDRRIAVGSGPLQLSQLETIAIREKLVKRSRRSQVRAAC
jgi:hypothetical protein